LYLKIIENIYFAVNCKYFFIFLCECNEKYIIQILIIFRQKLSF